MAGDDLHTPARVMGAIIRNRDAPAKIDADFEGYLRRHGVSEDDVAAMLRVGAGRFNVYRKLVHNRLRATTAEFIERTYARIGRTRFVADFEVFMEEAATASPYLREVPREFVDWVAPRWLADTQVEDYFVDLARHELLEYDVRNDPSGRPDPTGLPLALDKSLRFDPAARLMQYDYAVHRLPADEDDRTIPEAIPTRLLVYRDADVDVRYLELSPLAEQITRALMVAGMPVADGLRWACEQLGDTLGDDELATAAAFLSDLAERGIMLGSER
jgi:hypothetical protein